MKEELKINFLEMLKKDIKFKDGFWVYKNETVMDTPNLRQYIRNQGIPILEKDITDFLSELSFNTTDFDVDQYFKERIALRAGTGKSEYFASMDKLYPGNKFREIFNYYLFGDGKYCFILIGYGQTGKSTMVNLLREIIGAEYFGRSGVSMLRNQHGTAVLEGKKIFEVAEAQDLDLDTANALKSVITNDPVMVNPKFQQPRTIIPHVKLVMTCNNMPHFKATDDGIIRRIITITMNNKIDKQDDKFIEKMKKDIPNIIGEALLHPFRIEDFAKEQYYIFESDTQYGYGYGDVPEQYNDYFGKDPYEKYREMTKALGLFARSKVNFDKFIELEKIYKKKCDTTSKDVMVMNGSELLNFLEENKGIL